MSLTSSQAGSNATRTWSAFSPPPPGRPGWPASPDRASTVTGYASDAIDGCGADLTGYDAYIAGPAAAIVPGAAALHRKGVAADRVFADSFGLPGTDLA
ncbi:MAG TPA: hypothetical protein VMV92_18980 [Streptosporangiaceae bacterium]|nr:hypothetical protein [Streptosporangiaceae bacterium]